LNALTGNPRHRCRPASHRSRRCDHRPATSRPPAARPATAPRNPRRSDGAAMATPSMVAARTHCHARQRHPADPRRRRAQAADGEPTNVFSAAVRPGRRHDPRRRPRSPRRAARGGIESRLVANAESPARVRGEARWSPSPAIPRRCRRILGHASRTRLPVRAASARVRISQRQPVTSPAPGPDGDQTVALTPWTVTGRVAEVEAKPVDVFQSSPMAIRRRELVRSRLQGSSAGACGWASSARAAVDERKISTIWR